MAAYAEASKALLCALRGHDPAGRGALDRRGRSSTSAAWSGSPHPLEIAVRLRQAARERSDCLFPSASPARSIWPRSPARSRSRTGCCWPPERELAFLHALPVERVWGIGPATATRCNPSGSPPVGHSRGSPRARSPWSSPCAARQLHALANNRDPRPVRAASPPRSIAPSTPRAQRPVSCGARDRPGRDRRASPVGSARPGASAARSCSDSGSTTTPGRPAHRPCATRPRRTHAILDTARGLLAERSPLIRERGLTLVGITIANLQNDLPFSSACPLDPGRRRPPRRGPRPDPRPLGPLPSPARPPRTAAGARAAAASRLSDAQASASASRRTSTSCGKRSIVRRQERNLQNAGGVIAETSTAFSIASVLHLMGPPTVEGDAVVDEGNGLWDTFSSLRTSSVRS